MCRSTVQLDLFTIAVMILFQQAVEITRKACGFSQKIEVECRSYKDACSAAEAGADIVMLDNFDFNVGKALRIHNAFQFVKM